MNVIAPLRVDMILAATSDMKQTTDLHGEIVICTGMFRWSDGTIRDSSEPVPGSINLSTEEVEEELEEEYEEVESEEIYEEEPPTLRNPRQEHHYDGPVEQSKVT